MYRVVLSLINVSFLNLHFVPNAWRRVLVSFRVEDVLVASAIAISRKPPAAVATGISMALRLGEDFRQFVVGWKWSPVCAWTCDF